MKRSQIKENERGAKGKRARTFGGLHDKFVNSQALSTSGGDSGAGAFSEAQSSHLDLGQVHKSHVIRDGADNNNSAGLVVAKVSDELAKRDGRSHGPGCDESPEDGLAEGRVRSPREELEKLHKRTMLVVNVPLTFTRRC